MKLEIHCAMCGTEKSLLIEQNGFRGTLDVKKAVKDSGWIAQQNGSHFDVYCSEKCAE